MKSFTEVNRAIEKYVSSLDRRSSYSLDRIEKLLDELGNPQEQFRTVHIAGTSGKTSTSYFIANILKTAGYKTGLSVSPYVEQVNERVQIGTEPLPEPIFCREFSQFFAILERLSVKPTYFELFVAFVYWYFAKIKVDWAVVEVGLGGLLDATNLIRRQDKVCAITDIGLDHTSVLGNTIGKIAEQKAGIIQDHNHVFMYRQSDAVNRQVIKRSKHKHAVVHYVTPLEIDTDLVQFQKRNWTLAKEVCSYIFERDNHENLSDKQWQNTTRVAIPGRLEIVKYKGKTIVLDGAHNPQKVNSMIQSFKGKFPGVQPVVLLAIGGNKTTYLSEICPQISKLAKFTYATTFRKGRDDEKVSTDPTEIAKYFEKAKVQIEPDLKKSLTAIINRKEEVILVTGSLYLVGAVKKELRT